MKLRYFALAFALFAGLAAAHGFEDDGHVGVQELEMTLFDYAGLAFVVVSVAAVLFFAARELVGKKK